MKQLRAQKLAPLEQKLNDFKSKAQTGENELIFGEMLADYGRSVKDVDELVAKAKAEEL